MSQQPTLSSNSDMRDDDLSYFDNLNPGPRNPQEAYDENVELSRSDTRTNLVRWIEEGVLRFMLVSSHIRRSVV